MCSQRSIAWRVLVMGKSQYCTQEKKGRRHDQRAVPSESPLKQVQSNEPGIKGDIPSPQLTSSDEDNEVDGLVTHFVKHCKKARPRGR